MTTLRLQLQMHMVHRHTRKQTLYKTVRNQPQKNLDIQNYLKGAKLKALYMEIKLKYMRETAVTLPGVLFCAGHCVYGFTCHCVCLTDVIIHHLREREAKER